MTLAATFGPLSPPLSVLTRASVRPEEVAQWLQRARQGERAAIGHLLDLYRDRVLNLAWQVLRDRDAADDATQEIFVRAFEHLPRFRGESEFGTWLYRLALNYCLEKRRHDAHRARLAPQVSWEDDADAETPSHLTNALLQHPDNRIESQVETRWALERALDALPETLRWPLVLREWHGLSYEEIAGVMRLPVGTVRSRLSNGRRSFIAAWGALQNDSRHEEGKARENAT